MGREYLEGADASEEIHGLSLENTAQPKVYSGSSKRLRDRCSGGRLDDS